MTQYVSPGQTFTLTGTFAADGTLIAEGSGATQPGAVIAVPCLGANNGTINLEGGSGRTGSGATLSDTGALNNDFLLTVGGGDHSVHSAHLLVTGFLGNAGTLAVSPGLDGSGGVLRVSHGASLSNTGLLTLAGGGAATDDGSQMKVGGRLSNYGQLVVGGGLAGAIGTAASVTVTGTFENFGEISVQGGSSGVNTARAQTYGGVLTVTKYLYNRGLIDVQADLSGGVLSDAGQLENAGTIRAEGNPGNFGQGAAINVSGVLTNTGLIELAAGHYGLDDGYFFVAAGSRMVDSGSVINTGSIVLDTGYSNITFREGNPTLTVSGTLTSTGDIAVGTDDMLAIARTGVLISSGTINVSGGSQYIFYGLPDAGSGATLTDVGTLTNSGTVSLAGGIGGLYTYPYGASFGIGGSGALMQVKGLMTNTGSLLVGGGMGGHHNTSTGGGLYGAGATLNVSGVLTNKSALEIGNGKPSSTSTILGHGGRLLDDGTTTNTGIITLDAGLGKSAGMLTVTTAGSLTDSGTITGGGTLDNDGVIDSGAHHIGTGAITVGALVNDGTITVSATGGFLVGSAVTAAVGDFGAFDILKQATLTLGAAVGAGQSVAFVGNESTLALGDAVAFGGTLDGLAAHDAIDFLQLDVTSATVSGTTLAIGVVGGPTLDLALGAPLTGVALVLRSDGHGGTDLLVQHAAAADYATRAAAPGLGGTWIDEARGGNSAARIDWHPS